MSAARDPWGDKPDDGDADFTRTVVACMLLIGGRDDHGLPEPVARYIRGEAASLPASLGWVPESERERLTIARRIVEDAARKRREKAAERERQEARFPAPVLHLPRASFEPAIEGAATGAAGELRIDLAPDYETASYTGTRAQLEAEGLIPKGTRWPTDRHGATHWERGPVCFSLTLAKPDGASGRTWEPADWWRVHATRRGDLRHRQVRAKERELARARHAVSPAGDREWSDLWRRSVAAHDDARFQAVLGALLPPGIKKAPTRRKAAAGRTVKEGGAA